MARKPPAARKPTSEEERRPLSSFGRRAGRKLPPAKQQALDWVLARVGVQLPQKGSTLSPAALFGGKEAPLWLEIGFGNGEHLLALAKENPGIHLIGGEPFINGVAVLARAVEREGVENIRIVADDIRPMLNALPDGSVERIYLLYPDPWPKPRHHKRRIVSDAFVSTITRLLKTGGFLQIATDHIDYSVWMLEHLLRAPGLAWRADSHRDWQEPPEGWSPTRYEVKTKAEGRQPVYLKFERR